MLHDWLGRTSARTYLCVEWENHSYHINVMNYCDKSECSEDNHDKVTDRRLISVSMRFPRQKRGNVLGHSY